MRAITWSPTENKVRLIEIPIPILKPGEVLIQLQYAALNHLDIWTMRNNSAAFLGSDGAGIIKKVAAGIDSTLIGKEVIINPALHWGTNERYPAETFDIIGTGDRGTFAEYIAVPVASVFDKPVHLSMKEAAALPMTGLTAYRALFKKAKLRTDDVVLITGVGGGAAVSLLQFAVAAGAKVYVTSSSDAKIQKAIALGAEGGFNYMSPEWATQAKEISGGFDVIVDSAAGNGFAHLTEVAKEGARIVLFGRTAGKIHDLDPGIIFNKQLSILGTLMGSNQDFQSMLDLCTEHAICPVIDSTFHLQNITDAFEALTENNQFGKISICIR